VQNLTVLITGGTGSLGVALTEELLRHEPKSIRIYSRNEYFQHSMINQFKNPKLRFFIGDIRDSDRLRRAMTKCDVVIHTAALKHISTCEYNPIEAIRTNIDGCVNVINACIDSRVPKCLFISSDKAVYPVNFYGATKMVGERLFLYGNVYGKTKFSVVRFGNFFGSRGSVVEIWQKQRESGEIIISDENMSRYWITFEEASKFTLSCIYEMVGGEIFIPKMPSSTLKELADYVAPDAKKKITGISHGEKFKEDLITEEESKNLTEKFDRYIIKAWSGR
jgi:FlaA1/EpsC-like NDP-sugar epimerase